MAPIAKSAPAIRLRDIGQTVLETPSIGFEWINIEDKNARRKARSHVKRESIQRHKAETLRFHKIKESTPRALTCAPLNQAQEENENLEEVEEIQKAEDYVLDKSNASDMVLMGHMMTFRTILDAGRVDSFGQLPAKLNSTQDLGLVDHYYTMFTPKPFLQAGCDYRPFRNLTLTVVMQDAAAFLLVISGSAIDVALRQQKPEVKQSIEYRGRAMEMINKRMQDSRLCTTDGAIAACAVLAGLELLWGTPKSYNIHMDGLEQMLQLRGGFLAVQATNPSLASLIAWHDFAGVAALATKRRYAFLSYDPLAKVTSFKPLEFASPLNCPQQTLPPNYTLYDDFMILLEELENAVSLFREQNLAKDKSEKYRNFVAKLNHDLIRILSKPSIRTTPFRRFLIEDSFRIACLIYISVICKSFNSQSIEREIPIRALKTILGKTNEYWGHMIEMLLQLLTSGGKVQSYDTIHYVSQLMDFFVTLTWNQWSVIRESLWHYFLTAELCAGPHQKFWLSRTGI